MPGTLTIRELITSWGFTVDDKALKALDRRLEKLQSTVKFVGGAAIGAAASIFGLATSAGEAGASIKHAADRIGISTDALQEYQYAARLAGQSNEGFQSSLQTLIKNLFDARRGLGSSREAFYLLSHVLGRDLLARGLSAEEVLNSVADGLDRVADPSRKLELASQLFGGDAGAMLTTLKGGSTALAAMRAEARATGVVMSGAAVVAAEQYRRILERVKSTVIGLKNDLGVALFPAVERLMVQFRTWITINRQWIAQRVHESFAILETFIRRVIFVTERIASVANTAAIAFGGWNRVLKLVTNAMVVLLSLRIFSFLGQMVPMVLKVAKSFRLLGEAGLLANLEIVAIGAAIAGLILIIEDVVAYFQGRKSITGLILKDFEGSGKAISDYVDEMFRNAIKKLDAWVDEMMPKMHDFGVRIGKFLVDGLEKISTADWGKVVTGILNAFKLILDASSIPFALGMAIANGIFEGLIQQLRVKFPAIASALGLDEQSEKNGTGARDNSVTGINWGKAAIKGASSIHDELNNLLERTPLGIVWNMIGEAGRNAREPDIVPTQVPTPSRAAAAAGPAPQISISAPVSVTVPPNTPPEQASKAITEGVRDAFEPIRRETHAALKSPIDH